MLKKSLIGSLIALGAAGSLVACGGSGGQPASAGKDYPTKSIRWVIPFNPGGATDTGSRVVAKCLEGALGQTIVVENVTGAGGARGFQELAQSKPDGYTIGVTNTPISTVVPLSQKLKFGPDDLSPIAGLYEHGMMVVVNKDSAYKSAKELFAAAKAKPGEISVGVPGMGSPKAVFFRSLSKEYGIEFNVVPLDGTAGVNTAVMGGHVDAGGVDAEVASEPFVKSGDFRPLVVIGKDRWSEAPDVPTLEQEGFGNATLPSPILFLAGPAKLPNEIVTALSEGVEKCLTTPEVMDAIGPYVPKTFAGPDAVNLALDESMRIYEELLGAAS